MTAATVNVVQKVNVAMLTLINVNRLVIQTILTVLPENNAAEQRTLVHKYVLVKL